MTLYDSLPSKGGVTQLYGCPYVCVADHFSQYEVNCSYITQFLADFGKILDSKSYDQV